jgi:Flp pilus assembly protein TadG
MVKSASHRRCFLLGRLPFKRLARDRSGVSAVEFALILPLMLALYVGGIQISEALSINRKVSHVTSTLADLVTQSKSLTDSDLDNIFDASSSVMAPYSATPLQITVSEIKIDSDGTGTVQWSDTRNGTALASGATVTLPAAIAVPDSYVVMAVAHYPFTPAIGYVLTGSFDLNSTYYLKPRLSDCVSTSSYTCP